MAKVVLPDSEVCSMMDALNRSLRGTYEFHPFLVGWYNELLTDHGTFDLPYERDTLAIAVFTIPNFFEEVYVPWLRLHYQPEMRDPIDRCFKDEVGKIVELIKKRLTILLEQAIQKCKYNSDYCKTGTVDHLNTLEVAETCISSLCINHADASPNTVSNYVSNEESDMESSKINVRTIFDFELDPVRRSPRVIMQVAAHVAGGAYYYRPADIPLERMDELERACEGRPVGVSLHPHFGGHFAMRAVLVIPECRASLRRRQPVDPLRGDTQAQIDLLVAWTRNWRDPAWRSGVGRMQLTAENRYSNLQMRYFAAAAGDRERRNIISQLLLEDDVELKEMPARSDSRQLTTCVSPDS